MDESLLARIPLPCVYLLHNWGGIKACDDPGPLALVPQDVPPSDGDDPPSSGIRLDPRKRTFVPQDGALRDGNMLPVPGYRT